MKTITRISGVDCKIGRNSRTGSTISITVPDEDIIDVVQYFNDFKAGEEPTGKIKKIELVLYGDDDMEELNTREALEGRIRELTQCLEDVEKVADNEKCKKIIPITELKCDCGEPLKWKNVAWSKRDLSAYHICECGFKTENSESLNIMVDYWNNCGGSESNIKFFIENFLNEEFIPNLLPEEKEPLPPNQPDLKMTHQDPNVKKDEAKKCTCNSPAFVNGKCANCGGAE